MKAKPRRARRQPKIPDWGRQLLEGQARLFAAVEALRAQHERRAEPQDADAIVAREIASLGLREAFTAAELFAHAGLRDALSQALIENVREFGHLLGRLRDRGLIDRDRRGPNGWRWRADMLNACTSTRSARLSTEEPA